MANMTLKTEGAVKLGNAYGLKPESILIPDNVVRKFNHTKDAVMDMMASFEEQGQKTPIRCRRQGKDLVLVFGNLRLMAAMEYNKQHPDKPMLIEAMIEDCNAEDAFFQAWDENEERDEPSLVDRAFAQKHVRDGMKWSDKDIAKRFGDSAAMVSRLRKLTTLREKILKMIHVGDLSLDVACDLSEFSEASQDDILARQEALKKEHQEKYEERVNAWIKDAKEIDKTVPPPSGNGKEPKGGKEGETPAKTRGAQPGGKTPPKASPAPTTNAATRKAIQEKQEAAAAARESGEKPATSGKGSAEDKLTPPNFKDFKIAMKEEFIDIKNAPEPAASVLEIILEWAEGKISQAKMVKDVKTECKRYDLVQESK